MKNPNHAVELRLVIPRDQRAAKESRPIFRRTVNLVAVAVPNRAEPGQQSAVVLLELFWVVDLVDQIDEPAAVLGLAVVALPNKERPQRVDRGSSHMVNGGAYLGKERPCDWGQQGLSFSG